MKKTYNLILIYVISYASFVYAICPAPEACPPGYMVDI